MLPEKIFSSSVSTCPRTFSEFDAGNTISYCNIYICITRIHAFLEATPFFNSGSVILNFSRIQLQMLLRCCLLHITIIILRHILYFVYLCPRFGLALFMPYLCVSHFSLKLSHNFIKTDTLAFVHFLEYHISFG